MNGSVSESDKQSLDQLEESTSNSREKSRSRLAEFPRIKREQKEDIKDYAETTMNELLGWYGYDKFDSRETQALNLQHFASISNSSNGSRSNSPLLASSSAAATPTGCRAKSPASETRDQNLIDVEEVEGGVGVCHSPDQCSDIPGRQSKESNKDLPNIPPGCILCAWCQKVGMKLFTLRTTNGCKAFCSELCFTQCRRASFKKNKVCDWCKHVRHTVNYVDFQDGEQQLQFCSDKCLNQYKMNIFCKETQAHLQLHPHLQDSPAKLVGGNNPLITPDLWLRDCKPEETANCYLNGQSDEDMEQETPCGSFKRKEVDSIHDSSGSPKESISFSRSKEKDKESKRVKQSSFSNFSAETVSRHREAKESSGTHASSSRRSTAAVSSSRSSTLQKVPTIPPTTRIAMLNRSPPLVNPSSSGQMNSSGFSPTTASRLPPYFAGGMPTAEHLRSGPIPPHFMPGAPSFAEMMMRMHQGLRNPVPFPTNPMQGPIFPPIPHIPQVNMPRPTNIPPQNLLQPPFVNPQNNSSLLIPPVTVMVPFPILLPIPLPIPIPFPIPVKKMYDQNSKEVAVQVNLESERLLTNGSTTDKYSTRHRNGLDTFDGSNSSAMRPVDSLASKLAHKIYKAAQQADSGGKQVIVGSSCKSNFNISEKCIENDIGQDDAPHNLVVGSNNGKNQCAARI